MKNNLTNLFPAKIENRLFSIARSEFNNSSYGHGSHDAQSAEIAVATEIVRLGLENAEDAYETAQEITSRVIGNI